MPLVPRVIAQLGGNLFGDGQVALTAEVVWRQRDLLLVPVLLPRTELGLPEVERRHSEPG